jgi:hypothetical protein
MLMPRYPVVKIQFAGLFAALQNVLDSQDDFPPGVELHPRCYESGFHDVAQNIAPLSTRERFVYGIYR